MKQNIPVCGRTAGKLALIGTLGAGFFALMIHGAPPPENGGVGQKQRCNLRVSVFVLRDYDYRSAVKKSIGRHGLSVSTLYFALWRRFNAR